MSQVTKRALEQSLKNLLLKKPLNPCFAGRCQIKIVQN